MHDERRQQTQCIDPTRPAAADRSVDAQQYLVRPFFQLSHFQWHLVPLPGYLCAGINGADAGDLPADCICLQGSVEKCRGAGSIDGSGYALPADFRHRAGRAGAPPGLAGAQGGNRPGHCLVAGPVAVMGSGQRQRKTGAHAGIWICVFRGIHCADGQYPRSKEG